MIFGFSALLLLMVILAFDSIQALHDLEANSAGVRQAYLSREESLRKIRLSLYESGNLLTLTNSTPETRDSYLLRYMICVTTLTLRWRIVFANALK
jgi:hypothetical protein